MNLLSALSSTLCTRPLPAEMMNTKSILVPDLFFFCARGHSSLLTLMLMLMLMLTPLLPSLQHNGNGRALNLLPWTILTETSA
jgi:hypothetical protein